MRYSLLNRLQGTLLGMVLAEVFAREQIPQLKSDRWHNCLSYFTQSSTRQLINFAKIEIIPERDELNSIKSLEPNIYQALAIAVPTALLNHEQETQLVEQLRLAVTTNPTLQTSWEGMLVIGYLISQSLTEKLKPKQIISQICNFLPENAVKLIQELEQVQSWINTSATLEKVYRHSCQLEVNSVSLAIYSFLSTPEDYVLTVQRALHLGNDPFLICALAGALSGAYNGFGSIPVSWYLGLDSESELEIEQLSQQILATWSGVYQPQTETTGKQLCASYAIAAPQVMSGRRH
jgi:hypothetical protein